MNSSNNIIKSVEHNDTDDIETNAAVVNFQNSIPLNEKIQHGFIFSFICGIGGMALGTFVADSLYPELERGAVLKTQIALAGFGLSFIVAMLAASFGCQYPSCLTQAVDKALPSFSHNNSCDSSLSEPLIVTPKDIDNLVDVIEAQRGQGNRI